MKRVNARTLGRLLMVLTMVLMAVFCVSGCKTKYVPVEKTICRDVVKYDTLHKMDSIYIHDSISTWLNGDTVYKDRIHTEKILKLIFKTRTDTFIKVDSIPIATPAKTIEKELSWWEQFQLKYAVWFMGAACILFIALVAIIYRRIIK